MSADVLTIREALRALDSGDLTHVELMRTCLANIDARDRDVQAWLDVRPTYLMEMAAAADRRRTFGRPAPSLFGIPIGVKDIIDVVGYQTVCNMRSREHVPVATRDAEVVHRLRNDGALIVGKTVTQEAAAGVVSEPCRNPYDPERIPGGSSGGSAAAVATGTCLGALGTDTGGSIRIPAALCGVVGFKPTYGQVPLEGIFPLSPSLDTVGPLARTVWDATALWLSMAGRGTEITRLDEMLEPAGASFAGRRIGVLEGFFRDRVQPEVAERCESVASSLADRGAEIVRCQWHDAVHARTIAAYTSLVECAFVHRRALREAPELMGEALRSRVEIGALLPADTYLRLKGARLTVRESAKRLFAEHRLDAALTPSEVTTAPRADDILTWDDGSSENVSGALTRYTQPWNATGQPVFSIPAGMSQGDLPIGVAVIGRPLKDMELAITAHAIEHAIAEAP